MLARVKAFLARVFPPRHPGEAKGDPGRSVPEGPVQPPRQSPVQPRGVSPLQPPRHLGDIWHALQAIAVEEDPRFRDLSVVEHFNSSGEGVKDVERWLEIYQRRLDPERKFAFPAHHRRHRGHCLVARNWPDGLRWDAFDERTLFRVPIPRAPDAEALVRGLDEYLDAPERPAS